MTDDTTILDSQITASSLYNSNWAPHLARLNQNTAWGTHDLNLNQWLQVVLNADHLLLGVQTQGKDDSWVKSFKVDYSTDDGATWQSVNGADGQPEVKCLMQYIATFEQNVYRSTLK